MAGAGSMMQSFCTLRERMASMSCSSAMVGALVADCFLLLCCSKLFLSAALALNTAWISGSFCTILRILVSPSLFAFLRIEFLSSLSRQPGIGSSTRLVASAVLELPSVPYLGLARASAIMHSTSKNSCSSRARSPDAASSPLTMPLAASRYRVSSTWSARSKMPMSRASVNWDVENSHAHKSVP